MRIAALDIGTNTALLLIVESGIGEDIAGMKVIADNHAIARLGEGVDKTGVISEESYQRLREVLQHHMKTIGEFNVSRIAAIGTSALRDAKNRDEMVRRVRDEFGFTIEVISGETEAELTFRGALFGLPDITTTDHLAVLDIGGGSTELSYGTPGRYDSGQSMNIGAVRLTERYFRSGIASRELLESASSEIELQLRGLPSAHNNIDKLVAVAGTPTTLAMMAQHLPAFDRERIHGYKLSISQVESLTMEITSINAPELTNSYPAIHSGRADILPAGSVILLETMRFLKINEIVVSTYGLRYGIALREIDPMRKITEA